MMPVPRLEYWRQKRLLGLKALAKKAGVNVATIRRLEADGADAYSGTIRALAEALGVEAEELVKAEAQEA